VIFTFTGNSLKHSRDWDESCCVTLGASPHRGQKENTMMSRHRLASATATIALAIVATVGGAAVPSIASASTGLHLAPKAGATHQHITPARGTAWAGTKPSRGTAWAGTKPSRGTAWAGTKPSRGQAWTGTKPSRGQAWTSVKPS
jgi:hypothetical protein